MIRRPVLAALLAAVLLLGACATRGPVLAPSVASAGAPARVELEAVPFFPQERYQCGPAALATVLAASGAPADPDVLASQVYLPGRQGSLQPELLAATRRAGLVALVLPPRLDALLAELSAGRPVLVLQNLGLESLPRWHYAVVVGFDAGRQQVVLRSGTTRRQVMGAEAFMRSWVPGGQWGMVVLRPGELPAVEDAEAYFRAVLALEQSARGLPATGPGNGTDVAGAYTAGVWRWPDHRLLRIGAGNALLAEGRAREAAETLAPLVAAHPRDAVAVNNLASAWLAAGEPHRAREVLEVLPESINADPAVREALRRTRAEVDAALAR
jgi:tetratricopeptide (TPR) repeat protein